METLDFINELFLGLFLRTRKAPHPSAGNGDQLLVTLLPVLPVSQGLMWACPWLLFCLVGEVMSRSLCVCSLLGRMSRKLQAGPSPYTLPGLGALSPTAQYMCTWVHSYVCVQAHTHSQLFSSSQVILILGFLAVAPDLPSLRGISNYIHCNPKTRVGESWREQNTLILVSLPET